LVGKANKIDLKKKKQENTTSDKNNNKQTNKQTTKLLNIWGGEILLIPDLQIFPKPTKSNNDNNNNKRIGRY
jgi:hypothetical protein